VVIDFLRTNLLFDQQAHSAKEKALPLPEAAQQIRVMWKDTLTIKLRLLSVHLIAPVYHGAQVPVKSLTED